MEIQKDIGAEVLENLKRILEAIKKMKQELLEKDAKIAELESKSRY